MNPFFNNPSAPLKITHDDIMSIVNGNLYVMCLKVVEDNNNLIFREFNDADKTLEQLQQHYQKLSVVLVKYPEVFISSNNISKVRIEYLDGIEFKRNGVPYVYIIQMLNYSLSSIHIWLDSFDKSTIITDITVNTQIYNCAFGTNGRIPVHYIDTLKSLIFENDIWDKLNGCFDKYGGVIPEYILNDSFIKNDNNNFKRIFDLILQNRTIDTIKLLCTLMSGKYAFKIFDNADIMEYIVGFINSEHLENLFVHIYSYSFYMLYIRELAGLAKPIEFDKILKWPDHVDSYDIKNYNFVSNTDLDTSKKLVDNAGVIVSLTTLFGITDDVLDMIVSDKKFAIMGESLSDVVYGRDTDNLHIKLNPEDVSDYLLCEAETKMDFIATVLSLCDKLIKGKIDTKQIVISIKKSLNIYVSDDDYDYINGNRARLMRYIGGNYYRKHASEYEGVSEIVTQYADDLFWKFAKSIELEDASNINIIGTVLQSVSANDKMYPITEHVIRRNDGDGDGNIALLMGEKCEIEFKFKHRILRVIHVESINKHMLSIPNSSDRVYYSCGKCYMYPSSISTCFTRQNIIMAPIGDGSKMQNVINRTKRRQLGLKFGREIASVLELVGVENIGASSNGIYADGKIIVPTYQSIDRLFDQ